jgi:hypothetical protein
MQTVEPAASIFRVEECRVVLYNDSGVSEDVYLILRVEE